jgi:hypothetical protein
MIELQNQLELNILCEELEPQQTKRVALFLGRFSPPTAGHYAMINELKKFIREHKELNLVSTPAVVIIGGSKSDLDKTRNPLSVEDRESFMKASGKANGVLFFTATNAFEAFATLRSKGYEPIAIAAGTDRIENYMKMLDKYFLTPEEKPIKHYPIHLERDEEATETKKDAKGAAIDSVLTSMKDGGDVDTRAVSGSLARRAVELGYEPEFAKIVGLENKPELAKKMFAKIAVGLKG